MHRRCKKLGKSVREFIEDLKKVDYDIQQEKISR